MEAHSVFTVLVLFYSCQILLSAFSSHMIHFLTLLSIIYKCPLEFPENRLPAICRDFYAFGSTILTHWGAQHQMNWKLCQHDDSSQNKGEWKRTVEQHTQGTSVILALTEMKGYPCVVGGSSGAACWGTFPRGCLRQWRQQSRCPI